MKQRVWTSQMRFSLFFIISLLFNSSSLATIIKLKDIQPLKPPYKNVSLKKIQLTKKPSVEERLYYAEIQRKNNHFSNCAKTLRSLKSVKNQLKIWVLRKILICEVEASVRGTKNIRRLEVALSELISSWSRAPGYTKNYLKKPMMRAADIVLGKLKAKKELWGFINFFKDNQEAFPEKDLAKIFFRAGKLAESEKNMKTSSPILFTVL